MVKLRLRRIGKKKFPIYRIVAADTRSPRNGRFIEIVGQYDPNKSPAELKFKDDRVFYWLRKGAQPTDTVRSLFRRTGLWLKWTLAKNKKLDDAGRQAIIEKWQMQQVEKTAREADKRAQKAEKKKKAEVPAEPAPAPAPAEQPAA